MIATLQRKPLGQLLLTKGLIKRRRNIRRVIHNFRLLTEELGDKDTQLAEFVDSSNANFKALANQSDNIQAALRELPPTLRQADTTLTNATGLANQIGVSWTLTGAPDRVAAELAAIGRVGPAEIKRVAAKVLDLDRAAVVVGTPAARPVGGR